MNKLVLVDFDGTLFDTDRFNADLALFLYDNYSISYDDFVTAYESTKENGKPHSLQKQLNMLGITDIQTCITQFTERALANDVSYGYFDSKSFFERFGKFCKIFTFAESETFEAKLKLLGFDATRVDSIIVDSDKNEFLRQRVVNVNGKYSIDGIQDYDNILWIDDKVSGFTSAIEGVDFIRIKRENNRHSAAESPEGVIDIDSLNDVQTNDQINTEVKRITFLGVGGHGPLAYKDLTTNPANANLELHMILGTDDCGGHTKILFQLLELMNLGVDLNKVPPMGDLRCNIEKFLFELDLINGDKLSKQMEYRYKGDNMEEFIVDCMGFCNLFNLDNGIECSEFISFCRRYFGAFLQDDSFKNKENVKHSIGNIFLTYLFIQNGLDHERFFEALKQFGFIPQRVFPHFVYNERLILEATNIDTGIKYISEEQVDEAKLPMSPVSYKLIKADGTELTAVDIQNNHPEVLNALHSSEMAILSPGSIANLFGQLNVLAPELQKFDGLITWLGNIAKASNEVVFEVLLAYYFRVLGLEALVLQMDEKDFNNIISESTNTFLKDYMDEGKTFVNIKSLIDSAESTLEESQQHLVQPILGVTIAAKDIEDRIPNWQELSEPQRKMYLDRLGGGIKYVSKEITFIIQFVYEFEKFLKSEINIDSKEIRYRLLGRILTLLNLPGRENGEATLLIRELTRCLSTEDELSVKKECLEMILRESTGEEIIFDDYYYPENNEGAQGTSEVKSTFKVA